MQKSWRTVTFLSLVLTYVMSIVFNKQKWMVIGKQTWQENEGNGSYEIIVVEKIL